MKKAKIQPMPGDVVRFSGINYIGVKKGDIGCISGKVGVAEMEYLVTFGLYGHGPFRDDKVVSCSGGPGTFININDLQYTGETLEMTFWNWGKFGPRAGGAVPYTKTVPVWEWAGE